MAINSGQLYGLGAVLFFLIVTVIITYWYWYKNWTRQESNQVYQKFKDGGESKQEHQYQQQYISQRTPKIKLNTVEFTVPQVSTFYATDFEYNVNEKHEFLCPNKIYNDVTSSDSGSTQGVKTKVGFLKPELYSGSDDDSYDELPFGNIGRVWFSLEYDAQSEKLIVNVDRVRNLPGREKRSSLSLSTNSTCDPCVRLYLLPDEKRYLQSKMKRKTRNPVFKETFMFTMSYNLLVERTLRITIFDVDRLMRQTIIGHVLKPLTDLDIMMTTELWRDVVKFSQPRLNSGRLQVGLTRFPDLNMVSVNLISGQNLGNEEIHKPDCYVKMTYSELSKVRKVKKSKVHKCTADPFFNQTLEFKMGAEGMEMACLNFEIYHNTPAMVKNDKLLGSFIVGGSLCARGKELEHWQNMTQKPQTVVKEWHDLRI